MRKLALLVIVAAGVAGCPDRRETIDQVGGAPKAQVDAARARLERSEDKLRENAAAAADAVKE